MTNPKIIFFAAFFLVCLLGSADSFGQTPDKPQAEPSYEVVLQILVASNNTADKSAAVPALSNIVKKLRTDYSFSNYRIASTYLQRIANTGNVEFKGVSGEPPDQNVYTPVFSEWTISQLLTMPDAVGRDSVSIRGFRFGQRVPIRILTAGDGEKGNPVINYEQIGLNLSRLNLPVNTPTVIGNLSGSNQEELKFLILTVRRQE